MSPKHKAEAIAFTCIDFRFQQMIDADLTTRGLTGKFDRIAIPGATKNFEVASQSAEISLRLHDPDNALIYEHADCGAYGDDNAQETHRANAQKLAGFLKSKKPNLKITTLIATTEGIKEL